MRRAHCLLIISTAALLLSGCADPIPSSHTYSEASYQTWKRLTKGEPLSIQSLPNTGRVTIAGKVSKIYDADEFILKDATGSIEVHTYNTPMILRKGEYLTINGTIQKHSLFKSFIGASKVIRAKLVKLPDGSIIKV